VELTCKEKFDIISRHNISRTLTTEQIKYLSEKMQFKNYEDSELIASAESYAESCYLVVSGEVDLIVNSATMLTSNQTDFFGIMGYFNEENLRPATYQAIGTTVVLELPYTVLDHLKKNDSKFYLTIDNYFTKMLNTSLIKVNESLVKEKKLVKSLMNFFSAVVLLSLFSAVIFLVSKDVGKLIEHHQIIFTPLLCLMYLLVFSIMMARSEFKKEMYGLSLGNWKKDLRVAIYFTVLFLAIMTGLKYMMIHYFNFNLTLFEFPFSHSNKWAYVIIEILVYSVFVFFQEFTVRGIVQGVVMSLADTWYEKIRGIAIVVLIFSSAHLGFPSYLFALLVIVPGLFWSLLYEFQERRLLGVIVSHIIIGVYTIFILGFGNVFLH
jgi:hypothetical protein